MIIHGGTIVNEGRSFLGDIVVEGDRIVDIVPQPSTLRSAEGRLQGKNP